DGALWHAAYSEQLERLQGSARDKFSAFVQAFHRYLVVACGVDPLTGPLLGNHDVVLPDAATVAEVELRRAMDYVDRLAPTDRVPLQGQLILVLGCHVPLRTIEYWCIRIVDVHCGTGVYIVIYPRRRDGGGKSPSVRRIEDIDDMQLRKLLIDMVRLRRA